jgi:two-component system chemotaxis response regulator CheB
MEKDLLKSPCELLLIAGSAGSLEVLIHLMPLLKPQFPFAILIVLHRGNSGDSALAELFMVKTEIPVREVEDKDEILPGVIYIAPVDYHLLCEKERIFSLDVSEKVNYSRPSIDVTFESAALAFGPALVAILLSGANADGTFGLKEIHAHGGITIAQNPETATVPYMPRHAISEAGVDYIYTPEQIGVYINRLGRS